MITISLCMIVKNENRVLSRCLESIKSAVDEIIIVDTGSSDNTVDIAKKYTDNVFHFEWANDFSAARNFAYSKSKMDYQMWLDADDILPNSSLKKLKKIKKSISNDIDIVTMKYITHFDANSVPIISSTRERLTKRTKNYQWIDAVHECIPLIGNIYNSDIEIWHKPELKDKESARNIKIYESLETQKVPFSPRQQYYFARELKDHKQFEKSAYYFEKFLNGQQGWIEDNIASCFNLSFCYQALEQQKKILPILTKSFEYDAPRAEICSEIGYYYKQKQQYQIAFEWFNIAANVTQPKSLGFIIKDYYGYIPNIECCVCLSMQNKFKQALKYNKKAAKYKPNSIAVEHNNKFLNQLLNIQHTPLR